MSTKQYAILLALATGAGSLPTMGYAQSTWTGGYSGSSGVDWHYSIREDAGRVQVSAFGWLNGERLPITCQEAILDAVRAFETTCTHSRQGAPGIPAYTRFVLQGRLSGNAATITYAAANRGKASILVRRQETAAKATPQVPTSPPLRATAPPAPLPQLTDEQRAFVSLPKEAVGAIQTALKQLGHYSGSIDGTAGPQTSEAIRRWQRGAGMPITGILTDPQQATLRSQASAATGPTPPSLVPPAPAPTPPKIAEPAASLNSQIARPPEPTSPAAPQPAELTKLPVQQAAPTMSAGRSFGDCSQVESLFSLRAASAFTEDPNTSILGVPTGEWTTEVLEQALSWGRKCIEAEKAKNVAARMQGELASFDRDVRVGLLKRREEQEELRRYHDAMDSVTTLPSGGSATCRTLATFVRPDRLEESFFGRPFGSLSPTDFSALIAKAVACKTAFASIRVPANAIQYQPPSGLDDLNAYQSRLLQEEADRTAAEQRAEQRQRDLADPVRRAQIEAAENEEAMKEKERQQQRDIEYLDRSLRASLVGKGLKRPSTSMSDTIIYCGGFFESARARQALVKTDILASPDAARRSALDIIEIGARRLRNREQVIGAVATARDLEPIRYAGLSDGLAGDLDLTRRQYPICRRAIDALESEIRQRR